MAARSILTKAVWLLRPVQHHYIGSGRLSLHIWAPLASTSIGIAPSVKLRVSSEASGRLVLQPRQLLKGMHAVSANCSASTNQEAAELSSKDEHLVRLFASICSHRWQQLPHLASQSLEAGNSVAEILGCVRHVAVLAGYPPALAAAKKLHAAGLLGGGAPGKAGGAPGNAFELVYAGVRDRVWNNLYAVEPVLSEYIRVHAYGDIYSSPGLDLRQKQLMSCAFLAEADMHDELFGHLIAAIRFGANLPACMKSMDIGFEVAESRATKEAIWIHAVKIAEAAARTVKKDFPAGPPPMPDVDIPDAASVRRPTAPTPVTSSYIDELG